MLNEFKRSFGTTKSNQYDRYAAKRLIERHRLEPLLAVIVALAAFKAEKYCPVVNSVTELERKWVSVGKFLSTKAGDIEIEV